MATRNLHIGGKARTDGWEILDVNPGPHVDHVANARDLRVFADGTFNQLYASHVAEHFDYTNELLAVLKEWRRVLAPGGTFYVSVPDLEVLARLFIDRENLSKQERFNVMRMIFGGHVDPHDFHLVGLDEELLTDVLRVAGFKDMRRVDAFGLFPDTSNYEFKGKRISCNIICTNP